MFRKCIKIYNCMLGYLNKHISIQVSVYFLYILYFFALIISFINDNNQFSITYWDFNMFQYLIIIFSLFISLVAFILLFIKILLKKFFKITKNNKFIHNKLYNLFLNLGIFIILIIFIIFCLLEIYQIYKIFI